MEHNRNICPRGRGIRDDTDRPGPSRPGRVMRPAPPGNGRRPSPRGAATTPDQLYAAGADRHGRGRSQCRPAARGHPDASAPHAREPDWSAVPRPAPARLRHGRMGEHRRRRSGGARLPGRPPPRQHARRPAGAPRRRRVVRPPPAGGGRLRRGPGRLALLRRAAPVTALPSAHPVRGPGAHALPRSRRRMGDGRGPGRPNGGGTSTRCWRQSRRTARSRT